jgi:hypothetical protein
MTGSVQHFPETLTSFYLAFFPDASLGCHDGMLLMLTVLRLLTHSTLQTVQGLVHNYQGLLGMRHSDIP